MSQTFPRDRPGEVKEYLRCEDASHSRSSSAHWQICASWIRRSPLAHFRYVVLQSRFDPTRSQYWADKEGLARRRRPSFAPPDEEYRRVLSYLVNMTRPDLSFTYSQLSKFVQSPGPVHLAAANRALSYREIMTRASHTSIQGQPSVAVHYLRDLVRD